MFSRRARTASRQPFRAGISAGAGRRGAGRCVAGRRGGREKTRRARVGGWARRRERHRHRSLRSGGASTRVRRVGGSERKTTRDDSALGGTAVAFGIAGKGTGGRAGSRADGQRSRATGSTRAAPRSGNRGRTGASARGRSCRRVGVGGCRRRRRRKVQKLVRGGDGSGVGRGVWSGGVWSGGDGSGVGRGVWSGGDGSGGDGSGVGRGVWSGGDGSGVGRGVWSGVRRVDGSVARWGGHGGALLSGCVNGDAA